MEVSCPHTSSFLPAAERPPAPAPLLSFRSALIFALPCEVPWLSYSSVMLDIGLCPQKSLWGNLQTLKTLQDPQ